MKMLLMSDPLFPKLLVHCTQTSELHGEGRHVIYREQGDEHEYETSRIDIDASEKKAAEALKVILELVTHYQPYVTGITLMGSSGGGQLMGRVSKLCREAGINVLVEIYLSSVPDWQLPLSPVQQICFDDKSDKFWFAFHDPAYYFQRQNLTREIQHECGHAGEYWWIVDEVVREYNQL